MIDYEFWFAYRKPTSYLTLILVAHHNLPSPKSYDQKRIIQLKVLFLSGMLAAEKKSLFWKKNNREILKFFMWDSGYEKKEFLYLNANYFYMY